ncbi:hypothetical protein J2778_006195 [Paraburkholderia graminis]|nr:hypothetical protein [Paraburkholderia graminis]
MVTTTAAYSAPLHLRATTRCTQAQTIRPMRRLHRYDRLLGQRMERRAQQHISPARACVEPSQPAHKKAIPRPDDAGTWYPRVAAILPQTLHRRSTGYIYELGRHRESRQHALIFGPGARDGRPLRPSCGGAAPCLKMTLTIPLKASARSFPRCTGRCQSVSSSHRKRCRIVGPCRTVLHVSRRLALWYRACRRMPGSPHSVRRLKSQHFEVRQAVSYLAFLANAPGRPKQQALLRKQPSVAFSRWLLKYIEFPIDVIGHSRTPESSFT